MTTVEIMQDCRSTYPLADRREMEYPFGWIPRRFATDGIIKTLSGEEISLYIFLSVVSDNCGISYYGDKRICGLTGLTNEALVNARFMLEQKGFITYKKPFYHVLKMPSYSGKGG